MSANVLFTSIFYGKTDEGKKVGEDKYEVVLGALNSYNNNGTPYLEIPLKTLLKEDGYHSAGYKIKQGKLKGEADHPIREAGQSDAEYIDRNLMVSNARASHHILKIWYETIDDEEIPGRKVVLIKGIIKPTDNEHGRALKRDLDDPEVNVCFSIRCFSREVTLNGTIGRSITRLLTFDWVDNNGLTYASKPRTSTSYNKTMSSLSKENAVRVTPELLEELEYINNSGAVTKESTETLGLIQSLKSSVTETASNYLSDW